MTPYENALFEMAKAYGLGSPESRAIITAMEHARIAQGTEAQRATTVEQGVVHDGPVRDSECAHTSSGGGK